MRKNQYTISIVVGVFIGAMIALMIGNTTTAILGGVVSAGFTAWMGSLQWGEARKFATEVAEKIDVEVHLQDIANIGGKIILGVGKAVKWLLLVSIRLAIALAKDVNARKTVLAGIVVLGIAFAYIVFLASSLKSMILLVNGDVAVILAIFLGIIPILIIGTFLLNSSLIIFVDMPVRYDGALTPLKAMQLRASDSENNLFLFDWFYQLIADDHGAIISIARMLYIRTGNALRIIAYPFVLIPWGAVALANNKTGASALVAMILSGMHLSVAYFAGGIDTGSANFWLSLVVAMGLGVALGRKVSAMREPAAHRPLPSIKLLDQVAFHHS